MIICFRSAHADSSSIALDRSKSQSFGSDEAHDEAEVSRIASSGRILVSAAIIHLLMSCMKRLTGLVQNLSGRFKLALIVAIWTTTFHRLKEAFLHLRLHE